MRMRLLMVASLLLALSAAHAEAPLAPQSPIDWPPKAVKERKDGKVPNLKAKNQLCVDCHKDIWGVKSTRKNVPNLHRLHAESKKIAYKGVNRDCMTCHENLYFSESKARKKEGWFAKGDVYHSISLRAPAGAWKKTILSTGMVPQNLEDTESATVEPVQFEQPYVFKPSLKRLVCVQCHSRNSKIKTLLGAPEGSN